MFYQNNNDYMRDAFYYSVPQTSTYQPGCSSGFIPPTQNGAIPTNMMCNNMMNSQMMTPQSMQRTPLSLMYPQVYRIINPVANRVISNSNSQFITEDTLNNMVDTVYNIVEGDVSSLSNTNPNNSGDDTVTQGAARGSQSTASTMSSSNSSGNSRQTTVTESSRSASTTVTSQNNRNREENQLLRDLIKIIIIKELLARQWGNSFAMENSMNNFTGFANNSNSFFDPRTYGFM